jgi:large subunit ribosomal protein L13
MKTTWKSKADIKRKWYLVDLKGQTLGRACSQIASLLIGKGKVDRVPNMDCGDYVVAINAKDIEVTGRKSKSKKYFTHSDYPGGLREETFEQLKDRDPSKIISRAVKNMLPQTKLRDGMFGRLFVYNDADHKQEAQKPEKYELKS